MPFANKNNSTPQQKMNTTSTTTSPVYGEHEWAVNSGRPAASDSYESTALRVLLFVHQVPPDDDFLTRALRGACLPLRVDAQDHVSVEAIASFLGTQLLWASWFINYAGEAKLVEGKDFIIKVQPAGDDACQMLFIGVTKDVALDLSFCSPTRRGKAFRKFFLNAEGAAFPDQGQGWRMMQAYINGYLTDDEIEMIVANNLSE
jgi:phage anti-repressor protein